MLLISRERAIGLQQVKPIETGLRSQSHFSGSTAKPDAAKLSLAHQSSKTSLPTAIKMKLV
jgi:hypothetical protein